jgi:hypothetical protein
MNKRNAIAMFNDEWNFAIRRDSSVKDDSCAKRIAFVQFIDSLYKDGQITDKQAFSWENPF